VPARERDRSVDEAGARRSRRGRLHGLGQADGLTLTDLIPSQISDTLTLERMTMCPGSDAPHDARAHPLQRFMHLYMRRTIRDMQALLRELQLSMPQVGTLHFLSAEGGQSVSAIADHLDLSLAATSHLVERLVQRDLLTRAEDPHDRRQKRVELAPGGVALVEGIHRQAAVAFDELLAPLPRELRERFERDTLEVLAALTPREAASA
jgi:MarR family transcriptional regulator, organic hydroperoxide resistance regulator